ncbi:hypothetical protein [Streptomyces marianii]|uniref:Uncharacterized protein n=1 Tax=Streptomyces marianii TaxID=1817406 RepID=A0A5R9DVV6_9ACTN|nr:hypothetical protein [Streptomyces marianii]TLQ39263.1 hypothetical protein FEF34_38360 [Streptomyces marianii]
MRTSNTYTRHWDLETRQHELLGLDLGEGLPRTTLKYGAVMFPLWWGAWLLLFGMPLKPLIPLFLLPPLFFTYYGAKRSTTYWRRTNLLVWGLRLNFLNHGVRPVIGRGRIPPSKVGLRLRTQRLAERAPQLTEMPAFSSFFTTSADTPDAAESCGKPAHLRPRLRMYGPDAVAKARTKTAKRQRRSARHATKGTSR